MTADLKFLTGFADGAVMVPLGVAVAITLALFRQRRAAIAWTVAVVCVWAATLSLKLCGYTIAALAPSSPLSFIDLVTPSGHVASAAVIYGGLGGLLLSRPGPVVGRAVLAAVTAAVVIGFTRVLLHDHSLAEVMTGGCVGIVGAAALAWFAGMALDGRARLPVIAVAIVVLVVLHGQTFTWEPAIRGAALHAAQALKT